MPAEPPDAKAAVQTIKKELDILFAEQSKALQLAVYVGMSQNEVKQYEQRLERIKRLVAELAKLKLE